MTTQTLFTPVIDTIIDRVAAWFATPARAVEEPEQTRARRDFIAEMQTRNPDAFASESDMQGMMHLFGDRF